MMKNNMKKQTELAGISRGAETADFDLDCIYLDIVSNCIQLKNMDMANMFISMS